MLNLRMMFACLAAVSLMSLPSGCGSSIKTVKMSEVFELGGGQWMVRRAECATMLSSDQGHLSVETIDNYLIRVRGYIWNPSPAPLPIDQELVLVDRNGVQYDPHPQSALATHPYDISTTRVVPAGQRVPFGCTFIAPNDVKGMELLIQSPNGLHPPRRVKLAIMLIRQ
jgi:hypothetical protein